MKGNPLVRSVRIEQLEHAVVAVVGRDVAEVLLMLYPAVSLVQRPDVINLLQIGDEVCCGDGSTPVLLLLDTVAERALNF